jgi:hypothetical protein
VAIKTCRMACCGVFLLLLIGLLSIGAEETKREPCRANPDLVGPCMPMRGRIGVANGAYWAKIWKVGTKRILGIHRDIPLPQNLQDALGGRWDVVVIGDFVVCPFTKDIPGHMQSVCVESAAHLRVKKQDALHDTP